MENTSVVQIDDLTTHNIPLSASQIQSQVPTPSNCMKAEGGKDASEEKLVDEGESLSTCMYMQAMQPMWLPGMQRASRSG